jgi:hypothetical protein
MVAFSFWLILFSEDVRQGKEIEFDTENKVAEEK